MSTIKPEPGDDLLRLSQKTGVSESDILRCEENKDLFACRSPDVLFTEDEVFIPQPKPKVLRVRTGDTKYIVYCPPKRTLHLELRDEHGKLRHADYELTVTEYDDTANKPPLDLTKLKGPLYGYAYQGIVHEELPAAATKVRLVLDDDEEGALTLALGRLDPVSTTRGLKVRLLNLGLYVGAIDDAFDADTAQALRRFQLAQGRVATGEADPETRGLLISACGG